MLAVMKALNQEAEREAILYRLSHVRPESPRLWGKMTAHQMICHLRDSYEVAMGLKQVGMVRPLIPRKLMKYVALQVPMKWPKGVATVPELDQNAGAGSAPGDFAADRELLVVAIERFSAPDRDFTFADHAIFGPMTEQEGMRWGYLHPDHHLRQFGC
jgi:hypothetical protein